MKNIIIATFMLLLPSLAMAQGQVTRKPVTPPPTHKHSVNGPKDCTECNRLRQKRIEEQRRKEQERIAEQQRLEEQQRREEEQRKRKAEEEAKLAEQKRKEEQRLAEERERKTAEEKELAEKKRIIDNIINNMVYVEGGMFLMGPTWEQEQSKEFRKNNPVYCVTLPSYLIGKYEVTQEEWETIMGTNPSCFKGKNRPVECVEYLDCIEFIYKLQSFTGLDFRLPTESEWEFAARGGTKSKGYYKYSGSNNINEVGWCMFNSEGAGTHDVGLKSPNDLGLYDMSGNVFEWCSDMHSESDGIAGQIVHLIEGMSSHNGSHVYRGGSYRFGEPPCKISARNTGSPNIGKDNRIGFRLALSSKSKNEEYIPIGKKKVTGFVVDKNDEPIIGANVIAKNKNGTITDIDGKFILLVDKYNTIIEIEFVGYKKVKVNGEENMKIVLR